MVFLLSVIFFVSGVAALVLETLWFRQAGLAFGNGVWASSLILSSFMAGLALGNALISRIGARITHPVRVYAWLELAVALGGFALVLLLPLMGGWLAPVLRPFLNQLWLLNALRLGLAFLLLMVPATAMGATLPLLVKALRARDPNFGAVLGRLYGWNTLGAVLGAVLGELALIEWFGVRGTGAVAASLDILAAAGAFALARRLDPAPIGEPATAERTGPSVAVAALLGATFFAGFALLALEVVWFRFLQLYVAPSSLAFSLMLSIVLAGIGLGGFVGGILLRLDPRALRHGTALAFATGAVCSAVYAAFLPLSAWAAGEHLIYTGQILRVSFPLMFPIALLSGVLFTLTGTALAERLRPAVRAAGYLTLANTAGGGIGSLVGGFLILPLLGMEGALFALAALYGGVALLLWPARLEAHPGGFWRRQLWPRYALAAAFVAALALFPFGHLRSHFLDQALRVFGYPGEAKIAALREGRTETVVYLRGELAGEPNYYRLVTGSFGMASNKVLNRRYMKLYVYWPVALHPRLESALLISYGIGNTAKAMTDTKSLSRIDVVDISREILSMGDIAFAEGESPLEDPRVRVFVEDGRYYLQSRQDRYDLITSEPPPPKHAGVVNLYTREYFQLIHDRLNEGGMVTYWLPVHSLTESDTKAIIRAFCDVFDDCTLWNAWEWSFMLAGSRNARWQPSREHFEAQWRDPEVAPELHALGFEFPEQIGAMFIGDAPYLRDYTGDAPPLTDNFPKRLNSRYLNNSQKLAAYGPLIRVARARERFLSSEFIARSWPQELIEGSLPFFRYQAILNRYVARLLRQPASIEGTWQAIHRVTSDSPLRALLLWLLGSTDDDLAAVDRLLARGASKKPVYMQLGARALADRDFDAAARYYRLGKAHAPGLFYLEVYALLMAGRPDDARAAVRGVLGRIPIGGDDHGYWAVLAREFDFDLREIL
jgi:spermidine synthase